MLAVVTPVAELEKGQQVLNIYDKYIRYIYMYLALLLAATHTLTVVEDVVRVPGGLYTEQGGEVGAPVSLGPVL